MIESPPDDRLYTPDHVWIAPDGRIGVTHRLLESIAAIESLHLPAIGAELRAAESFAAIEDHKGTFDLYAPCDGRVIEVHSELPSQLALLWTRPYDAWLVRTDGAPGRLLDAMAYLETTPPPHRRR